MGQKQKKERNKEEEKRKRERGAKVCDNNGQATHGARKHPRLKRGEKREKDRTMVIIMAKLRMAFASRLGQQNQSHLIV